MRQQAIQRRTLSFILLALPLLNGCLVHTRVVKQAKMPSVVMTATADQLVKAINDRCEEIHSLSAIVDFQLTEGGPRKGREQTFTSFSGYILQRKPGWLRVAGYLPLVPLPAFDMATNGDSFKLWIPTRNKVFEGSNAVTKESSNSLENFRPSVFADSLLVGCIAPDDLVTLTSETRTEVDARSKQQTIQPDYELTVVRRKGNSQELIPERVIRFRRTDLQLYQEDMYDAKGAIQTTAVYGPMQTFGQQKFPGTVTIKRPLEELQILITIQKLTVNLAISDDKFELKTPEAATIQKLD
jgi:outer membrane lipoprotein-sorting protein